MVQAAETMVKSKTIYAGQIVKLRVDDVRLDNGSMTTREVIDHPGAVAILPVDRDKLVFVRQFRYPVQQELLEIPAGKLEAGEDPLQTARRELQEETGYQAGSWHKVAEFYTAAGYSTELMHLFLATRLRKGQPQPDEDERLQCVKFTINQVWEILNRGEIRDAKTLIALNWYFLSQVEIDKL